MTGTARFDEEERLNHLIHELYGVKQNIAEIDDIDRVFLSLSTNDANMLIAALKMYRDANQHIWETARELSTVLRGGRREGDLKAYVND